MVSLYSTNKMMHGPINIRFIVVFLTEFTSPYKMTRLSALNTDHLTPPGDTLGIHICQRLSRPQGHIVAGRTSMKSPDELIGSRLVEQCPNQVCHRVPYKISKDRKFVTAIF